MCVAVYCPKGLSLDTETLRKCFTSNPDGAGFAYIEKESNTLRIQKFMEFSTFIAAYLEKAEAYKETSPFLIHFRIKTHGLKDIDNCHPFQIDDEHVFIHNGIIRNVPDCPEKKKSDTRMFKETILQNLPEGWFYNDAISDLIEEYIGSFSKIVVLNRNGEVNIYNESKGTWKDGVWFSNTLWDTVYYDWRNEKKRETYTHADRCLQCQIWIKNNVYANKNSKSFCSIKCETAFYDTYRNKSYDLCEMCMKQAHITVYRGQDAYHYCSDFCKKEHKIEIETKEKKSTRKASDLLECCYCSHHVLASTCAEIEMSYGKRKETEFICVDCIPRAIDMGYIQETEKLKKVYQELQEDLLESMI